MALSQKDDMGSTHKQSCEITKIENAEILATDEYRDRYPLLRGKSTEELDSLNKAVLRRLDWKFPPCVTVMLLMKYVNPPCLILQTIH